MMPKLARVAATMCAVGLVLCGQTAHATPLTYQFGGTIDLTVLGDPFGTLSTGDTFQGVFTYDDATLEAPPFVPLGTAYNALTSFSMTISGETITGGRAPWSFTMTKPVSISWRYCPSSRSRPDR